MPSLVSTSVLMRPRFLDGDDAVLADFLHRVGDEVADLGIVGRNRRDLRDLLLRIDVLLERISISLTVISTALSMPCLMSSGLLPAVTLRRPSRMIACASTVAVVVPSPAMSLVFDATSLTSCAPMFSNTSGSSISLAMVTPSLVIVGEPNFLSSTTLRPLGPSVTFTASARMFAPRSSARRALSSNTSCFAAMFKLELLRRRPALCRRWRECLFQG